jgi:hypothetical protein
VIGISIFETTEDALGLLEERGLLRIIDLAAIDERSLRELQRLLRDLDAEQRAAVQRARLFPRQR